MHIIFRGFNTQWNCSFLYFNSSIYVYMKFILKPYLILTLIASEEHIMTLSIHNYVEGDPQISRSHFKVHKNSINSYWKVSLQFWSAELRSAFKIMYYAIFCFLLLNIYEFIINIITLNFWGTDWPLKTVLAW